MATGDSWLKTKEKTVHTKELLLQQLCFFLQLWLLIVELKGYLPLREELSAAQDAAGASNTLNKEIN